MTDECVVHSVLLDGKGGCREACAERGQAIGEQEIQWSHIEYAQPGAMAWIVQQGISETVAETLTRVESRPRMIAVGTGVVVILRAVNLNPGADLEDMVSLRLWIEPGRIISVRQRPTLSIQDIKSLLESGSGPATEGEFLVMLVERLAERIGESVDEIEEKISSCEEFINDSENDMHNTVSVLRRKTASIRRFLAPQREALDAVYRLSKNILNESESYFLREQADRITRYVEDLDLARERTLVLQEDLRNQLAEEQNSRTYLLSIVAAIFLPLSFLTGVFGMNVAGLPGTENGWAFNYVSFGMLLVAIGLIVYMRFKRWL